MGDEDTRVAYGETRSSSVESGGCLRAFSDSSTEVRVGSEVDGGLYRSR